MRTISVGLLLLIATSAVADEPKPPPLTSEEQKLVIEATRLDKEARQLFEQGKPAEAVAKMEQALERRRTLYPTSKYPAGHRNLAANLDNVGFMLFQAGSAEKAMAYLEQGLAMHRTLYPESKFPDGHPDLAICLGNMGQLLQAAGSVEMALPYVEQALAMNRKLYPKSKYPAGRLQVARSLNNVGVILLFVGAAERARPHLEEALALYRDLYPESKYPAGHPELEQLLRNMGGLLREAGLVEKAIPHYQQALEMARKLYPESKFPGGHPVVANSLNQLGVVLQAAGSADRALPYCEQSLAMFRRLYPESKYPAGHPELASSLEYLGTTLQAAGSPEKALAYYDQALEMYRKMYPESRHPAGHPDIANSLNNMCSVLADTGSPEKGLPYGQQALVMRRRLYPESKFPGGHPGLARNLNSVGFVLESLGRPEQAVPLYEEALKMRRKLCPKEKYPVGHPDLVYSLGNLGSALLATRSSEKALAVCEQALTMQRELGRRFLRLASEAEALEYVSSQPRMRDGFLSAAAQVAGTDAAAYRAVWDGKVAVTRLLEQRQANSRAAATGHGSDLDRLKAIGRRTEQLLQDSRMKPAERDKLLAELADERNGLERGLAAATPALKRWQEFDRLGPDDLRPALLVGSAFIDLISYTRFEYDRSEQGKSIQRQVPCYVAFVVTKDGVRRVELGEAGPINAAVGAWRRAIDGGEGERAAAAQVRDLVWSKLAAHLPAGAKALYLSPDGNLARVPWAALPSGEGGILLEDFALAVVPHGPFLLDHLRFPRLFVDDESLLAVGGLDYGAGAWPALPGTRVELAAVAALAPAAPVSLSGVGATATKLAGSLPKARYAHLATHGEFRAEEFAAEKKRRAEAQKNWREGQGGERRIATKNPLGYVGLVLSGGEVMSGLSILDLNLENLKLVTLSACETGLGEYTGGKGVESLQMAFHLAGAENVVASLWKVNDAATAALMAKFYHELWVNKKPPIEALREAQLTIYRHPELIPDLAGERGAPRLKEAVAAKTTGTSPVARHADTKLWAAFVLSGVGR